MAGRPGGEPAVLHGLRSLSIVLPARDEAANIAAVVAAGLREIHLRQIPGEVLVVDDGSEDATPRILRALVAGDERVRVLRLPARGYGAAVAAGLAEARFEHIFCTDADQQFDLRELVRLERHCMAHDVVVGFRAMRADPLHRRAYGWAWNQSINTAFGVRLRDVDCAFKLLHRRVVDRLGGPVGWSEGAFVSGELLVRALAAGFSVREVPVSHFPRPAGRASGADPRVIGRAVVDFARFYGTFTTSPRSPPA